MTNMKLVEINHLGAHGDGGFEDDGTTTFISNALPGETWKIDESGCAQDRVTSSPDRQQPICRHFTACGGCVAQHMTPSLYQSWKNDILIRAFAHRGLPISAEPLVDCGLGERRRTTFAFRRAAAGLEFGYHRAASHDLVDIAECPVLSPKITAHLPALRDLADMCAVGGKIGRMVVTALDDGLDIAIFDAVKKVSAETRDRLSKCALACQATVFTLNGEPIVETGQAVLTVNGARVVAPSGVFLQAAPIAEQKMAALATKGVKRAKQVADLFCGVGTFTFPLAARAQVAAFDGDPDAIASLQQAVKNNTGYKAIDARRRDLFRDPLSARELKAFDAIVINPPRAGAEAQCARLATSSVATIVMVACNPVTLARDAATLIEGGYRLKQITPIDQFVFSAHLEVVAVFQRAASSKR